jgi:ribosomal protein S18 acetylase RimI-like enzyme
VIRRAEARDLAALARLWRALLEQHAALEPAFELREGEGAAREAALERALERMLGDPDAVLLVHEDPGAALAGYLSARVERAPGLVAERARAEIHELAVAPERRREGVGRALVAAALAWAAQRGVARAEVRVAVRNADGQAFWRALGFAGFVDVLQRRL